MPRTRKRKSTDVPEAILDHFAGPARPMHFPTDEAVTKLLWLALRNITATWGKEANFWRSARNQFAIVYGERFMSPTTPTL